MYRNFKTSSARKRTAGGGRQRTNFFRFNKSTTRQARTGNSPAAGSSSNPSTTSQDVTSNIGSTIKPNSLAQDDDKKQRDGYLFRRTSSDGLLFLRKRTPVAQEKVSRARAQELSTLYELSDTKSDNLQLNKTAVLRKSRSLAATTMNMKQATDAAAERNQSEERIGEQEKVDDLGQKKNKARSSRKPLSPLQQSTTTGRNNSSFKPKGLDFNKKVSPNFINAQAKEAKSTSKQAAEWSEIEVVQTARGRTVVVPTPTAEQSGGFSSGHRGGRSFALPELC